MHELETTIFRQVCAQVLEAAPQILRAAEGIAGLDVACALGEAAARFNYVRPSLDEGDRIDISDGRHPMVERSLAAGAFVPNDTALSSTDEQIVVLTGPNMAGKSTYLRQVAAIVLMAQIGSFVPASAARIGLVDRIFTRVGAGDDLTSGQSTFMVEMTETSAILHNATSRSLIVLDEIGRGTSTYDGMAIARAVVEYLHTRPGLEAKVLFATHYHEHESTSCDVSSQAEPTAATAYMSPSSPACQKLSCSGRGRFWPSWSRQTSDMALTTLRARRSCPCSRRPLPTTACAVRLPAWKSIA
jgi:DNA mismatch repair protein MutS